VKISVKVGYQHHTTVHTNTTQHNNTSPNNHQHRSLINQLINISIINIIISHLTTTDEMASYTPLQLPYYAPADALPAALPSVEEIEAIAQADLDKMITFFTQQSEEDRRDGDIEEQIETSTDETTIIIGEHFLVRFGKRVHVLEAENMIFVRENSKIRVPTVYAVFEKGDKTFIIMENVKGRSVHHLDFELQSGRSSITDNRTKFRDMFREVLKAMREMPSLGYYGCLGRRDYDTTCYWESPEVKAGPFDTIEEFNAAFRRRWACRHCETGSSGVAGYADRQARCDELFKELVAVSSGKDHSRPVFTHGDLRYFAVYLEETDELCIVHWDKASFMPEYFESTRRIEEQEGWLDERFDKEYEIVKKLDASSCVLW